MSKVIVCLKDSLVPKMEFSFKTMAKAQEVIIGIVDADFVYVVRNDENDLIVGLVYTDHVSGVAVYDK